MAEYVITTENAADLPESFVKENEIGVLSLYYTIDGVTYGPGHEPQMSAEDFYAKMRAGMMPKTQQVNLDQAMETFRSYLKQGKDILHLALTSAVSGSCNSAMMAARELKEEFPERTITVRYTDGTEDAEEETFTLSISRDPEEKAAAESDTEEEDEEITAYARVGESEIVYQLTQSEYESLMACSYDDLRHDEAFTAGFDRVTSVDITLEGTDYTITSEGDDDERTFYYGEEEVDLGDLRSALADALAT